MLKFFVADQCTQRHNKKHQPTCLDDFNKKLTHYILSSTDGIQANAYCILIMLY